MIQYLIISFSVMICMYIDLNNIALGIQNHSCYRILNLINPEPSNTRSCKLNLFERNRIIDILRSIMYSPAAI